MPKPRLGTASCQPRRRVGSSGALVALKFLAGRLELDLDNKLPLSEHVNYLKAGEKKPKRTSKPIPEMCLCTAKLYLHC